MIRLSNSPSVIPSVGLVLLRKLRVLGIETVKDLLFYFPFRYDEYIENAQVSGLQEGSRVSIVGTLKAIENVFTRNGKRFTKALFQSEGHTVPVIWFNQPYLAKSLQVGSVMRLNGKVSSFGGMMTLVSPERLKATVGEKNTVDLPQIERSGEPIGVYSETAGLSSKKIREMVQYVWKNLQEFPDEYLPYEISVKHELMSLKEAIRAMHFPKNLQEADRARSRFSFEEMFLSQLRSHLLRHKWRSQGLAYNLEIVRHKNAIEEAIGSLPFILTDAQRRSLDEILGDLGEEIPMNRLLEGDVGSGKTAVAAMAMYGVYLCGYKSLLMAPTQILATQHYATVSRVLESFGVKVALVVSGVKGVDPEADIFIGTHALLHQKVKLEKVGFTVIDEQHRFGVGQRAELRAKHGLTHVLSMTATPIPRTLALTLYGDLDLSVIDQMPAGRKPVKTRVVTAGKREEAYEWIRRFIKEKGEQVFVVCPFVEPSESSETIKSAVAEYDRLRTQVFPDFHVGLLHGKMKNTEKDAVLQDFREKKYEILVCTPVVEVGIDIPNASIIVIESAERFGLAQLHQFRGRVGRGGQQAFCLLFTSDERSEDSTRLQAMEDTNSGITLAEIDLKYRGSGNLFGMQQSGRFFFKYADLFNTALLQQAKEDARSLLNKDPELLEFPALKEKVAEQIEYVEAN